MKQQYIRELAEGMRVEDSFVVSAREMRATRGGEAYLSLGLSDRTGRMPGVWFRPSASAGTILVGTVVHLSGTVTRYRGLKRISVHTAETARAYDPEDMLASGHRDRDELIAEFKQLASRVGNRELRQVLRAVFGDTDFFVRFAQCPGAQSRHHAYLGGLIEHTISVANICETLAGLYGEVDADMLLAAALLHDIGKVDELDYEASIEYTDEGRLIGHVVLGERRVHEALARSSIRITPHLLARVSHAILAHHGELEWGSPKRPSTLEALLLHHADNLDAKAAGFIDVTSGAIALEERWTDAQNLFRRPLHAPMPVEDERPLQVTEDDQYRTLA